MQKNKLTAVLIIAILAISVALPVIQTNLVSAQPNSNNAGASMQINYDGLGVVQHKMTPSELQAYKENAGINQENHTYQTKGEFGTGLMAPTEEGWSEIAQKAYIVENVNYQAALPSAVDLSASPWFPPIGDQGQQGSCASFATGYYCKTYQEAKEHQWDLSGATWTGGDSDGNISAIYQSKVMSPAFVYNLINGGEDVGSDFETPIRLVSNVGICSWQNMPYYWQDCTRWPTEAAWTEAPLYRSNSTFSYQYLYANTTQGLESLKNWLAAGNPAIIAIDAYDNLWNYTTHSISLSSQDLITTDTYTLGDIDHAATIVGYDDLFTYTESGSVHHGAIKIANSWGKGGWENIADGCYWISYDAFMELSTASNPVVLFQNLDAYQPEILASFNIDHQARGDCFITFGLGTPQAPIAAKNFSDYVTGGNKPFCTNNVVFDLSEFKANLTSNYNQPFFMSVYDKGLDHEGTADTGTVKYFAIADSASTQTPMATANGQDVNLTVTYSFAPTTLSVLPVSGPAGAELTLTGTGITGTSVDISYYDPVVEQWVPVVDDYGVSTNFTFVVSAPDLYQNSPIDDHSSSSDDVVFRVQDSSSQYNATYTEMRRGLTQVYNQTSNGIFGNNTDLSTDVLLQNGQSVQIAGAWFKPGSASIFWDAQNVGSTTVDFNGSFNASLTVPTATAGKHSLMVSDGNSNVSATVTRLPTVANDYTAKWQTQDFTVNLTPDYTVTETYYRINNGQTYTVTADGQPTITTQGADNTLEYWSTWSIYGKGNMELTHTTVMGIKLDKTAPSALLLINGGASNTTSNSVTLALSALDFTSGVKQVRFSNDVAFTGASWEAYVTSKSWQLASGTGAKTVYCQIQDIAGLITTVNGQITVDSPQPSATATPEPTPTAPEYSMPLLVLLLALLTASLLTATKIRGKVKLKS